MDASVEQMWRNYCVESGHSETPQPSAAHFCDNEQDANTCAALVLAGRKWATASSLESYEAAGQTPPSVGDLHIVTDWSGLAQCIIRTTHTEVIAFENIDAEHALAEGEGDGSLEWWRREHWAYYERELSLIGRVPTPSMPLVFERSRSSTRQMQARSELDHSGCLKQAHDARVDRSSTHPRWPRICHAPRAYMAEDQWSPLVRSCR